MQRRAFLVVGSRTLATALAAATGGANLLFARDRTPSSVVLEQRGSQTFSRHTMPKETTARGLGLTTHQQNGWRDWYSKQAPNLS